MNHVKCLEREWTDVPLSFRMGKKDNDKEIQVNLAKTIDKYTWQYYNEDMTRKLGDYKWRVFIMNKDEILAKSRAENKNKDVYEQEVLNQASRSAVVVQMALATIFFVTQIFAGGGTNWGLWAIVFSANMTINWVKYIKLHRKYELVIAIAYAILVSVMSGYHIYNLVVASTI